MNIPIDDKIVFDKLMDAPGTWDFESEIDRGMALACLLKNGLLERDGDE